MSANEAGLADPNDRSILDSGGKAVGAEATGIFYGWRNGKYVDEVGVVGGGGSFGGSGSTDSQADNTVSAGSTYGEIQTAPYGLYMPAKCCLCFICFYMKCMHTSCPHCQTQEAPPWT